MLNFQLYTSWLKSDSTTIKSASGANPLLVPLAKPFEAAIPDTVEPCAELTSRLVQVPLLIAALSQTIPFS